jgi:hypothetical protein
VDSVRASAATAADSSRVSTMGFRDDDFSVGVTRHFIAVVLDLAMDR